MTMLIEVEFVRPVILDDNHKTVTVHRKMVFDKDTGRLVDYINTFESPKGPISTITKLMCTIMDGRLNIQPGSECCSDCHEEGNLSEYVLIDGTIVKVCCKMSQALRVAGLLC